MIKFNNYNYRKGAFETRIPKRVAEILGLEEGHGQIQWTVSKNGVVTVKKVEDDNQK